MHVEVMSDTAFINPVTAPKPKPKVPDAPKPVATTSFPQAEPSHRGDVEAEVFDEQSFDPRRATSNLYRSA